MCQIALGDRLFLHFSYNIKDNYSSSTPVRSHIILSLWYPATSTMFFPTTPNGTKHPSAAAGAYHTEVVLDQSKNRFRLNVDFSQLTYF